MFLQLQHRTIARMVFRNEVNYPRGPTDAVLLTIIGEPCATRKYAELQERKAAIKTSRRSLLNFVSFFSTRHVLRGRPTNAWNAGPIKAGMRSPTPDKSFPKTVMLPAKRENENARLGSAFFSRLSEHHNEPRVRREI